MRLHLFRVSMASPAYLTLERSDKNYVGHGHGHVIGKLGGFSLNEQFLRSSLINRHLHFTIITQPGMNRRTFTDYEVRYVAGSEQDDRGKKNRTIFLAVFPIDLQSLNKQFKSRVEFHQIYMYENNQL